MHHTLAFSGAVGQVANTAIAAVNDQIITINVANFFQFQRDTKIFTAWASSTTLNRARINSPSLRQIANPQIRPINRGVVGATDANIADYRNIPLTIPGLENWGCDVTSDLAMGNEQAFAVFHVGYSLEPAPTSEIITIRFTGATAAVANTWTQIVLTPDDTLGQGEYAVVGADWVSATCLAFRLNFQNQYFRPGGFGVAATQSRGPLTNYAGGMGTWGRFSTTAMPTFEALCSGADNAHTLFLQVVRLYTITF